MVRWLKAYHTTKTLHTGETHKMPDGSLHSGKTHTKSSVPVFHMKDLSKTAKEKAMKMYGSKSKPKAKAKKKTAAKPKRKPMKRGY
jgi:hypothetical protein